MTPDNNPVQTDGGLIKTFKDILGISHRPIPVRHTHTTSEITEAGSGGTTSTLATILQGLRTLIAACEVLANKITSWGTPTNTQYPSAKLVKDSLDAKVDLDTTSHTVVLGDTPSVSGLDNETAVCEKVIKVSYARAQQSNVSDYAVLHVVETTRPSTKKQIVYLYNLGQVLHILSRTYSSSAWGSWSIKNMSLDVDTTPADDSDHLITSGAVYEGLAAKAPLSHTHTKSQITDFAHTHDASEVFYNEEGQPSMPLDTALRAIDNFMTETNTALAGKAPLNNPSFTGVVVANKIYAADGAGELGLCSAVNAPSVSMMLNDDNCNLTINAEYVDGSAVQDNMANATTTEKLIPTSGAVKTALDGKANTSHTHAISDVTGLQTALDGKIPFVNAGGFSVLELKDYLSSNKSIQLAIFYNPSESEAETKTLQDLIYGDYTQGGDDVEFNGNDGAYELHGENFVIINAWKGNFYPTGVSNDHYYVSIAFKGENV